MTKENSQQCSKVHQCHQWRSHKSWFTWTHHNKMNMRFVPWPPLYPNIGMQVLLTVLYTFSMVPARRIFWQSRASWICNHFLYSHYLNVWNQGWILLVSLFRLAMGCLVAVSSQSIQFKSPAKAYYINHKYVVTQFCGVQQKKKLNLQIFLFGIGLRWGCWCYHWEWRGAAGLRVWCLSHITKYTCQQIVWTRSNML